MTFLILILLSAVAFRVGYFIAVDSLIEEPRDKFALWLQKHDSIWADKALTLMGCPFCVTIWTGAGVTLYWSLVLDSWPGWWFPIYWLAVASGALLLWTIIDSE